MKTNRLYKYITSIVSVIFLILMLTSCYRQEVILEQIPANTGDNAVIFITGNFNRWDPGDPRYKMQRNENGTYSISLPRGIGELEYKFTRGDWTTVEKNECGYETGNRSLQYGVNEIVRDTVFAWGDKEPMNCIQKTIIIRELPANTPENAMIYLASSFNNWNPGDYHYIMQKNRNGEFFIRLDKQDECMDYKFTLGNWESVETDLSGKDTDNRKLCFNKQDTTFVSIKAWRSIRIKPIKKVVFAITGLPKNSRPGDPVYIAGNFNNWNPGDIQNKFQADNSGRQYLTLASDKEVIEFKFTRGNWASVETGLSGKDIPNRQFPMGHADTLFITIDRWKDR